MLTSAYQDFGLVANDPGSCNPGATKRSTQQAHSTVMLKQDYPAVIVRVAKDTSSQLRPLIVGKVMRRSQRSTLPSSQAVLAVRILTLIAMRRCALVVRRATRSVLPSPFTPAN